jgi:hypothetical protein
MEHARRDQPEPCVPHDGSTIHARAHPVPVPLEGQ